MSPPFTREDMLSVSFHLELQDKKEAIHIISLEVKDFFPGLTCPSPHVVLGRGFFSSRKSSDQTSTKQSILLLLWSFTSYLLDLESICYL